MKTSLATKFYLILVPLVIMGVIVILVTRASLRSNAQELISARQVKELAVTSLSLLFVQDDASKTLLIDMENSSASLRKIEAYDACQAVFEKLKTVTHSAELLALIQELKRIDEVELRPLDTKLLETMGDGKTDLAKKIYFKEYEPIRAEYETTLRKLVDGAEKAAQIAAQNMTQKNRNSFLQISSALIVGLCIVAVILVGVTRNVCRRLNSLATLLQTGAQTTSASLAEMSTVNQSLAEGANKQAAALEETSAALEEISSMTQRNAQNAQNAKEFTNQTKAAAASGAQSTQEMGQAMQSIRSASSEMRDAMNGIKAASHDVSKIIKTIDEIAFQTNLLALNAAVEAARAGEAGMGFAVVADEVRSLAQRSAKAAKETADLIETSVKRSEDGVRVTEKVAAAVQEVGVRSSHLDGKLAEILAKVQQVDEQVVQIASASQEQSRGISEVNMAVNQMDKVTQSNASSAEESAAAATELNAQAEVLRNSVRELQNLVGGKPDESSARSKAKFSPAPQTQLQVKPVALRKNSLRTPKRARGANDFDIPMPAPIGAGRPTGEPEVF